MIRMKGREHMIVLGSPRCVGVGIDVIRHLYNRVWIFELSYSEQMGNCLTSALLYAVGKVTRSLF